MCGNCSATYTGSLPSASSPHVGHKIRRNSHSWEQNEHSRKRLPLSPSTRSTPITGREPHKGQSRVVMTTGGIGVCAARNSAYGCRNARARNCARAPTCWSYLPACFQYDSRLAIQESEDSKDI